MDYSHLLLSIEPNGSVEDGSVPAILALGESRFQTVAHASLRLLPQPRFVFSGAFQAVNQWAQLIRQSFDQEPLILEIADPEQRAELLLRDMTIGDRSTFSGALKSQPLTRGPREKCSEVLFHVLNFPDFLAQREGKVYQNSLLLIDEDSQIEVSLEPMPDAPRCTNFFESKVATE